MMTCVYTLLPVNEATILTDPYKGSHVLRWSKSRGNLDSARLGLSTSRETTFTISTDDEANGLATPYRLPRIAIRGDHSAQPDIDGAHDQSNPEDSDKVWSRYGYEKIIRIPQLGPQVKVLMPPPQTFLRQYRHNQAGAPRFKNAAIAPTTKSLPWSLGREMEDSQSFRSHGKSRDHDEISSKSPRLEPTPTPISRSESPAKSVKSIHWILGHNRYHTFDKKGRSHIQGPYSREFSVTCMAPANWMRMKWGRSKTMVN